MITTELERLSAKALAIELIEKQPLPERLHIALRLQQPLRYGENPHQAAGLYVPASGARRGLPAARQLQSKELSYNTFGELEAARSLAGEFSRPAAVIIKHNNPSDEAEQEVLLKADLKAVPRDSVSLFE